MEGSRDGVGFKHSGYGAGAAGALAVGGLPCASLVQGEDSTGEHCHRREPPQQAGVGDQHHECASLLFLLLSINNSDSVPFACCSRKRLSEIFEYP